jgi:hypothetical protein
MKITKQLAGILAALSLAGPAPAQTTPPPARPPESRQFDFWVGEWDVTDPDGKPAGTNTVEAIAGGAGLLENWTGDPAAGGGSGKSLNTYNVAKGQWQQFWVGSGGGVLELAGALVNDSMVLTGEHDVRGRHFTERITWTPNRDGTVRQHWEQSSDGGKSWQTVFDGLYRKKKPR